MAGKIHIGTSGWNYDHWQGPFYPDDLPQNNWFAFYSCDFDTVEINNTFYHQPQDSTYDAWRKQAPDGFTYAVKANRYLTHLKCLKDPEDPLERFLMGARRLKAHLGPVLYQLPPNWKRNLPRLETFVKLLPGDLTHVVEFRNRDWLCDDTYALLDDHGVALCMHDMLRRHPRRVIGPIVYLRFHGAGKTYGGRYRKRQLQSWVDWIRDESGDRDVFAYFNNDENGYAVCDTKRLRELFGT
jgi:uncharacterized protein YecE (DUF72 family)